MDVPDVRYARSGGVAVEFAGSGIGFEERGEHELKRVPGTWRLYAVRGA